MTLSLFICLSVRRVALGAGGVSVLDKTANLNTEIIYSNRGHGLFGTISEVGFNLRGQGLLDRLGVRWITIQYDT